MKTILLAALCGMRTLKAISAVVQPKPPGGAMSGKETIETLQLVYRRGYPLMAMATNNRETYGSTINAFYNMKTAADEKSQRDKGFKAETLYSAGALDGTFLSDGICAFRRHHPNEKFDENEKSDERGQRCN